MTHGEWILLMTLIGMGTLILEEIRVLEMVRKRKPDKIVGASFIIMGFIYWFLLIVKAIK